MTEAEKALQCSSIQSVKGVSVEKKAKCIESQDTQLKEIEADTDEGSVSVFMACFCPTAHRKNTSVKLALTMCRANICFLNLGSYPLYPGSSSLPVRDALQMLPCPS